MADEQTGTSPSEPVSYDAGILADARAAFEEVTKTTDAPAVDDKPVETAAKDEPKTETVEAKGDHATDPKRYADGTFKPTKDETVETKEPEVIKPAIETKEPEAPKVEVQAQQPAGNPPPGWSVKSKTEWDKLPEYVRADILKREQEVNSGFAEYSGMKELRPYVERARSQGTTLKAALDNYIGIENSLRQQPLQALLHLAGNIGITPQRLAMELSPYLNQSNGQGGQQPGSQQPAVDPAYLQQWINPLAQEISGLKSLVQQQQEAQKSRQVAAINTVLERFIADPSHRYYHNVESRMAQLIEGGVVARSGDYATDLKSAYELACKMDPEISEQLINERIAKTEESRRQSEKEAAEKAKRASRSITGSPNAGTIKDDDGGGDSIEDDVRRAVRAHAA